MTTYNKIDTAQTVLSKKLNSLTAKYSNQEVTQALERLLRLKKRQAEFDLDKLRNFSIQFSCNKTLIHVVLEYIPSPIHWDSVVTPFQGHYAMIPRLTLEGNLTVSIQPAAAVVAVFKIVC